MAIDFNQILPELYVGTYPTSIHDIDLLKNDCAISAVLNLQSDADLSRYNIDWQSIESYYRASRIEVWRMPVIDFDQNDLRDKLGQCAATLNQIIRMGHRAYVHCTAGINRSPTVVIAYLHYYRGYDLKTAIKMVQDCRACDPHINLLYNYKFE